MSLLAKNRRAFYGGCSNNAGNPNFDMLSFAVDTQTQVSKGALSSGGVRDQYHATVNDLTNDIYLHPSATGGTQNTNEMWATSVDTTGCVAKGGTSNNHQYSASGGNANGAYIVGGAGSSVTELLVYAVNTVTSLIKGAIASGGKSYYSGGAV